jgi:hypothetical protein
MKDSLVSTTKGVFKNPFDYILADYVETAECSNGEIYVMDSLKHKAWDSWHTTIKIEAEDVSALITDATFQKMVWDENRVKAVWNRIKENEDLRERSAGMEETWDNAKKLVPKRVWINHIYSLEAEYLNAHPDSGYLTEILPLKEFPDYIDYLPKGSIVRKIGVMGKLPEINGELGEWIAISREEYEAYIGDTIQMILKQFSEVI